MQGTDEPGSWGCPMAAPMSATKLGPLKAEPLDAGTATANQHLHVPHAAVGCLRRQGKQVAVNDTPWAGLRAGALLRPMQSSQLNGGAQPKAAETL
eukprot:8753091-Pyramimonas_sp.AAC.1